jgi:nanoRNase/pAp phosphatase (c-di-AMP/oligoRNAs hydrolase)
MISVTGCAGLRIKMESENPDLLLLNRFKEILSPHKKVAIFTHPYPDPDAIGSMMGLKWMLSKFGMSADLFYSGSISHPQNRSMVNLLDPELLPVDSFSRCNYQLLIAVDCVPENASLPQSEPIKLDVVVDHHKEAPRNFEGLYINFRAGSACATVYEIAEYLQLELDENDSKVATAMMIGITTDTEFLMSDDCSDYEFNAWKHLFPFRDPLLLKQIINFERPKFWTDSKASAVANATVEDSIGVVGMGIIPAKHRDMIADMADEMVTWEDVNTAVVFAVVDGSRIEGSVRTKASSVSVPALCQDLAGKHGKGGGKLGKGAYRYELAGASVDEDEDEDIKKKTWELFESKETGRVFRIIRNK